MLKVYDGIIARVCGLALSWVGLSYGLDVSGTVRDLAGNPVSGVVVWLQSSGLSSITDADGMWKISSANGIGTRAVLNRNKLTLLENSDNHLRLVFGTANVAGQFRSAGRAVHPLKGSARVSSDDVDTLEFSMNGRLFLRDTISTSRSHVDRVYDTSWNEYVVYGWKNDARDGRQYRTVRLGDQLWMAENLNYRGEGEDTLGACYLHQVDSCRKYGRLYDWSDAMGAGKVYNGQLLNANYPAKGICPDGWHVPSDYEWKILEIRYGTDTSEADSLGYRGRGVGTLLMSRGAAGGTDRVGFRILLPGRAYDFVSSFYNAGGFGRYWSSSEYSSGDGYIRQWDRGYDKIYRINGFKNMGFSLRCLSDL